MGIGKVTRIAFLGLVLFAVTGMSRVPPGSDSFREGWLQGCFEGYTWGGWSGYDYYLDPEKLANDPEYKRGRDAAVVECFEEAVSRPRGLGPGR